MPLKADLKASKLFPCQLKLLITMDLLNLSIYPPFSDEKWEVFIILSTIHVMTDGVVVWLAYSQHTVQVLHFLFY